VRGLPHGGVPQIVSPLTPDPSNFMGWRKTSNNWGQININFQSKGAEVGGG